MSFAETLARWPRARLQALYEGVDDARVLAALSRPRRDIADLAALLSPAARPRLEEMAVAAQKLTRHHFGRTISLYAPIYLSNLCAADCVYCGFAARSGNREKRTTLRPGALRAECEALAALGFKSVLLLTGEAPKIVDAAYIAESVEIAREYFPSVAIEVYSMGSAEYALMVERGLEGVTLYMETYDRETYSEVHLLGEKADYAYRLEALERAGLVGARRLSAGVLLGLSDWRIDVLLLALHARYLEKTCWRSALSLSFPRLLHTPERYHVADLVSDLDLVQIMLAMRLFLPEAGFNFSTREAAAFRDRMIPLGVTHMSAGSSTRPGGYASGEFDERGRKVLEQFEIEDHRGPAEVIAAIRRAGYDPVWKDFDHAFESPREIETKEKCLTYAP